MMRGPSKSSMRRMIFQLFCRASSQLTRKVRALPRCKAPVGAQEVLVGADPARFFVPPYVGHKGWIGIRLDHRPDWDEVAVVVRRSYRLIAPKKLAALIQDDLRGHLP